VSAETLEFKVRSGGMVRIDLALCVGCATRPCVRVCEIQGGPLTLDEDRLVPGLRWPHDEIERGGCVECLGCELEWELLGRRAISILLPVEGLEEYLQSCTEAVVYER